MDQFYAGKFAEILDDFEIAKSDLKPDHKTKLDSVVTKMKANVALKAQLGGAADLTGDEKFNQALSLKRARPRATTSSARASTPRRLEVQSYGADWARVEAEAARARGRTGACRYGCTERTGAAALRRSSPSCGRAAVTAREARSFRRRSRPSSTRSTPTRRPVGYGEKAFMPYEPNVARFLIAYGDPAVTQRLLAEMHGADRVHRLALLHVLGKRTDDTVDAALLTTLRGPGAAATSAYLLGRAGFKGYPARPRDVDAIRAALRRHLDDDSTFEDPFYRRASARRTSCSRPTFG